MTTTDTKPIIGRTGLFSVWTSAAMPMSPFCIQVRIVQTRANFGRVDYLVEPVAGSGQRWVSSESVSLDETK